VVEGVEGVNTLDVAYEGLVCPSVPDFEKDTVFGRVPEERDGEAVALAGRELSKRCHDGPC